MASYGGVPREKWWRIQWFAKDDTKEERRFITKLDLILVPYLLLSYWVKNLDQNNLSSYIRAVCNKCLLFTDFRHRQCIRRRYEGRPRLLRERTVAATDNVHHWGGGWSDSIFVHFHVRPDVLVGAGYGYLLGDCDTVTVPCSVVRGDGGVSVLGRVV